MSASKEKKDRWTAKRLTVLGTIKIRREYITRSLFAILFLVFATYTAIYFIERDRFKRTADLIEEEMKPKQRMLRPELDGVERSPLYKILEAHYTASGIAGANSVAIGGVYSSGGLRFDLEIFNKWPNFVRQDLKNRQLEIVGVFDGSNAWVTSKRKVDNFDNDGADRLSTLNHYTLILEGSLQTLSWQFEQGVYVGLRLLDDVMVEGRKCHVIENNRLLPVPVQHFLDQETLVEYKRVVRFESNNRDYELEQRFGEPVVEDGLKWPRSYQLFLNGELQSEAFLQTVRINVGVMPWMFESI